MTGQAGKWGIASRGALDRLCSRGPYVCRLYAAVHALQVPRDVSGAPVAVTAVSVCCGARGIGPAAVTLSFADGSNATAGACPGASSAARQRHALLQAAAGLKGLPPGGYLTALAGSRAAAVGGVSFGVAVRRRESGPGGVLGPPPPAGRAFFFLFFFFIHSSAARSARAPLPPSTLSPPSDTHPNLPLLRHPQGLRRRSLGGPNARRRQYRPPRRRSPSRRPRLLLVSAAHRSSIRIESYVKFTRCMGQR